MTAERDTDLPPRHGSLAVRLKRAGLLAAITVATVNVWTGSPLLGLWVGSRVQGSGPPKMGAVAAAFLTIAAVSLALVRLVGVLSAAYDELTGRRRTVRRHLPWLRSMRGEREVYEGERPVLSALDRILVVSVVIAVIAFEIWFFFFSSSPIDQRSGRHSEVRTLTA
jgi:hypothetical protein